MVVVFPIANIGIQVFPQLWGILVNLHGGIFVALLQVFFEFRGRATHYGVVCRVPPLKRTFCQETRLLRRNEPFLG